MCRPLLEPAFTHKAKETGKIIAVMASEKDVRMFVQQGCFTIHSDQTALNERQGHQEYLSKITVGSLHLGTIEMSPLTLC